MTTNRHENNHFEQEVRLEEYRTLRQEILDYAKFQHDLVLFSFTGSAAIFTLVSQSNHLFLLLAVYVLLVPLRCRHTFYQEMIVKIGAYIGTCIEPSLDGLYWEHNTHNENLDDRVIHNAFAPARFHYFTYSFVAWVGVIYIILKAFNDQSIFEYGNFFILFIAVALSSFISYLDWGMLKKAPYVERNYKRSWFAQKTKSSYINK